MQTAYAPIPYDRIGTTSYPFPSEFCDPALKESGRYGVAYARAIYYGSTQFTMSLFHNDRATYDEYVRYALGEQDETKYQPLLKVKPDQAGLDWLNGFRWAIKNYATKRVNIAVSKIASRYYDPIVSVVDAKAVEFVDTVKAKMKTYLQIKDQLAQAEQIMGQSLNPGGVEPDDMPESVDEVEVWMQTKFKFGQQKSLEKLISHHLDRINYRNIKRLIAFDLFVIGAGVLYSGLDENYLPELYRCNPADMIVPLTEREDFSDIPYAANIFRPTIPQFFKLVGNEYPREVVEDIVKRFGKIDSFSAKESTGNRLNLMPHVPCLRFAFITTDDLTFLEKEDRSGNPRFIEEKYGYPSNPDEFKEKYGNTRKVTKAPVNMVYEGFWVIGSEFIFRYGLKNHMERNRGNLAETWLPYKMFAPNIKWGRPMSTMKQMIPVLDELQTLHIKKQHILASALPSVWAIDLNALRNAQFKWNDTQMTDQDKIEFLFQSAVFLFDSGDRFTPGSSYQPIRSVPNDTAAQVMMYVQQLQQGLIELDEIIGQNRVSSASTLRPDTLKGTAEIQLEQSEIAMEYLYYADQAISNDVVRSVGLNTLQSIKYRGDGYYERIIPSYELEMLKFSPFFDYGFNVETRPTEAQWRDFFVDVSEALKQGQIGIDDVTELKTIDNLKEAQNLLRVKVKRRRKEDMQMEQNKIDSTLQGQAQSNVQAHSNQMEIKQLEIQAEIKMKEMDREMLLLEHQLKMEEMDRQAQIDMGHELVTSAYDHDNEMQKTKLEIKKPKKIAK